MACRSGSRRCDPTRSGSSHDGHIAGSPTAPPALLNDASGVSAASSWVKGTSTRCWMPTGPSKRQLLGWANQALAGAFARGRAASRGWGQKLTQPWAPGLWRRVGAIAANQRRPVPLVQTTNCRSAKGPWGVSASRGESQGNHGASGPWWLIHLSMGPWQVWGPPPARFCPDG